MSRTPLIAGNWKMNKTAAEAAEFMDALAPHSFEGIDVAVCVPFTALWACKRAGTGVGVGIKPAEEYHHLTGVAQEPTNSQMGLTTSTNAAARDDNSDGYTDDLDIRAIVVSLDGQQAVEAATQRRISSREDAEEFGIEVARMLVEKGAGDILKEITLNRHIIEEQKNA